MKLTKEQQKIIDSKGDIKINAVAGSGKTTTVIEYAKTRPKGSKILYLAFNKSVKLDAFQRFKKQGLQNVKVETAHSLAYKNIVFKYGYKVKVLGYKTYEIAEALGLEGNGEKHTEYIIANHISKFMAYFCNSRHAKIQDLNYLDVVSDPKAKTFVKTYYKYIEKQTRILLGKMNKGEIEITHDFYLKKFQLSKPHLDYDYILFDEGQDASPAMLEVFINQQAQKVIVGDTHQQIYGWRFAVNSLEKVEYPEFLLSTSFRFDQSIANLGMGIIDWKSNLIDKSNIDIKGVGKGNENKSEAVLARTNLGLLLKAIEYITENEGVEKIYFEGNINSYTYADDGASLYDVLNLSNGKRRLIRDQLIKKMKNMEELEEYIKNTEDVQMGLMMDIVERYGNKIPNILKRIKSKHVENDDKDEADIIFSTVHRSKGMEYDIVHLVNDFINEEKIMNMKMESNAKKIDIGRTLEEINLLYVAITRAKSMIYIPETLLPFDFPSAPNIKVIAVENEEEKEERLAFAKAERYIKSATEKAYNVEEIRKKHKKAYRPWTNQLDEELTIMYCEGKNIEEISEYMKRTNGSIQSRIKKLELKEMYDV